METTHFSELDLQKMTHHLRNKQSFCMDDTSGMYRLTLRADKEVHHCLFFDPKTQQFYELWEEDWRRQYEEISSEKIPDMLLRFGYTERR